jgi:Cu(I)/Ag(I) efflux system membrane fusion protein/cobalt-zinc-cadmium efflux system membrane fusion protein
MRRGLIVVALLIVMAALTYRFRAEILTLARGGATPAAVSTSLSQNSPTGETAATPRGDVAIDTRRQQLIGVRTAGVQRTTIAPEFRTTGTVRADETRQVDVNVKLDGWIRELFVDYTGQAVRRGDRLFTLYSPDVLATENEFLLALTNRDKLQQSQVSEAQEYSGRLLDAARQRLSLWDVSAQDIATVERTRQPLPAVSFTAPASGVVVEKAAVLGMRVMPGQTLYKIADLSTLWVEADVYEQQMALVRVGARATITLDAYPGRAFSGRATYVYPTVEEQSRTVKVRFQFANAEGLLKPGMFANVELRGAEHPGLTIPANAVLDSGTDQIVFVAGGDGMFTPRRIKVAQRLGDDVEIAEGLKEGEQVATSAAFFLDSESQLRAGVQNYEAPSSSAGAPVPAGPPLAITFRAQPDPPKTGDNTFEVSVADSAGKPVADADVSVELFMPAMPTMNMPAMRNETRLAPVGGGVYRGAGQVMMAGRWGVTVTASRNGQRAGSQQFALVAR